MKPCYIPIVADDSGGTVGDDDAHLFKSQMALAKNATRYSKIVGSALCALVAVVALVMHRQDRRNKAQEQGLGEPLLGGAGPSLLPTSTAGGAARQTPEVGEEGEKQ